MFVVKKVYKFRELVVFCVTLIPDHSRYNRQKNASFLQEHVFLLHYFTVFYIFKYK